MKLQIVEGQRAWANTLECFDSHDSYHTWDFSRIEAEHYGFKPFGVTLQRNDTMLFMPLMERRVPSHLALKDLTSAYGYPGPLYRGPASGFTALWHGMTAELTKMGYVSLFSRCSPFFQVAEEVENAGFILCGRVVAIDLQVPEEAQRSFYRQNMRHDIKHAIRRGVECVQGGMADVDAFLSLYWKTMDRVGADRAYYFTKAYVISLLNATDFDCRIYFCKLHGAPIAAGLFIFGNGIVHYHLSGYNSHAAALGGSKVLIDSVRQVAAKEGYSLFNLGGGVGGKQDKLYHFKRGFSKKEYDFYLVKCILNHDLYKAISARLMETEKIPDGFFPAYRSPAYRLPAFRPSGFAS